ncbi:MAG: hypothetical protein UT05_C0003G0084 [Parcubacteria group bacterium GW2011_GWF2_38_76]|nr:MAG: hypothetical protein UT05_C0003G0084 [Parcubacteria group bacterium GW2011_GWF2_38_76]HBM46143.1 hypothetical protein [Patescibacteria group bacterium]
MNQEPTLLEIFKSGPIAAIDKNGPQNTVHDKNKLNDIYDNLPEDIKNAIASVDSSESIYEIGNKFKLHMDQIAQLGAETGFVLLGVTDPMEFVANVSRVLNIDKTLASQIVTDINEKIFVPVKESLRQIHSQTPVNKPVLATTPNIIKNVSAMELNVPKKTVDILKGNIPIAEKRQNTEILGFSSEKKDTDNLNIMEEKMNGSFSIPKSENGISKQSDPYREQI